MGEYSTTENVQIWVGTFNVNGRGGNMKENLSAWLCPNLSSLQQNPEIVAVGFQEIVELSPQQIMSTDPDERQAWENAVRTTLNDNAQKKLTEEYILVRTGQLVGAVLMIFVRSSALKNIKNVEGSVKKVRVYHTNARSAKLKVEDWSFRNSRQQRSSSNSTGLRKNSNVLCDSPSCSWLRQLRREKSRLPDH